MAGAASGLFAGLLKGVTTGVLQKQKQKHDDEILKNQQLSKVYLSAIENGDIDPQYGFPLVANIISGSFANITGDKKGSKKDQNVFTDVLGDPEKLSALMLGFHKATSSKPASGPAGPTGLPSAGPVAGGPDAGSASPDGTLASRATMQAPARTSIFRTPEEKARLEARSAAIKSGAVTEAGYDARVAVAQRLFDQGKVKSLDEGMERVGLKMPTTRAPLEGSLGAFINGKLADAQVEKGDALTPGEETQIRSAARQEWAEKGQAAKPPVEGTFGDAIRRREEEKGSKLTAGEVLKFSTEWERAHLKESPNEKLHRSEVLAKYRADLSTPTAGAYDADVHTTTTGRKYLDLSTYDIKTRGKARDWANANGVTAVSKEQANALVSVDTARLNQDSMKNMILSKLPKDALGRPITGGKNTLAQMAQTDPDLAAFPAWRESAVQQVRAMQGVGSGQYRLTQQMIDLIINNDIPVITDTIDVAQRKFDVTRRQLDDVENSITVKDRRTLVAPSGGGSAMPNRPDATVPDGVTQLLKNKGAGRYRMSDGTYWIKTADGRITAGSKDAHEK